MFRAMLLAEIATEFTCHEVCCDRHAHPLSESRPRLIDRPNPSVRQCEDSISNRSNRLPSVQIRPETQSVATCPHLYKIASTPFRRMTSNKTSAGPVACFVPRSNCET